MNPHQGRPFALDRFPAPIRRRLADLDRLRDACADHQRYTAGGRPQEALRRVLRRHLRELRLLAEQEEAAPDRLRAEEDILVELAAECRSGESLTPGYLSDLARRAPDFGLPPDLPEQSGKVLAEAATVETHPVIRAAHLFLACEAELWPDVPVPPRPHPLPWVLASLSLMRSGYPPLPVDRRLRPRMLAVRSRADSYDRLIALIPIFADLAAAALRAELSRTPVSAPTRETTTSHGPAPLAGALHRRIQEHLRRRGDSLTQVLRELDPDARVAHSAGDVAEDATARRCDEAATRALFERGPGCWWSSMEIAAAEAVLSLLVAVQQVGPPSTGVLAVNADGVLVGEEGRVDVLDLACIDCVTIIPTDCADERWPDVEAFVDDVASRAIDRLTHAMY
ncbi:hypothetical protein HNR23_000179 [Nocardiopsis mwathae]|uniref:Uncharacterized protein n=1 Tax=Nocardiopsis mwathae TaxID=1472723 RepID=A0A7X0D4I9_9ACTN|nr:hypothetical protein [Nocardiopsis mwathae]MBB6170119.1 hypothetical protein [Nocardiopsis mwathae]